MDEEKNLRKIASLVFMDLETTGLASDVGKKNVNITEMSFLAVDRQSFESDRDLRVINKISLCVKPRSVISHSAMSITALYNDVLEEQKEFDDSVPKLLEFFFRRLQAPICLLAHNGMRFDFPVLQAELNRLGYSLDPQILCADTIQAFRSILLTPKAPEPKSGKETHALDVSENDEIEALLSQDMESFINMKVVPDVLILKPEDPSLLRKDDKQHMKTCDDFLERNLTHKTPQNSKQKPINQLKRKNPPWQRAEACSAKRALFPGPPPRMSLESLYSHFFGEKPPQSHYAEMDCISLSKVCQEINQDFLSWIDSNSRAFSDVDALW